MTAQATDRQGEPIGLGVERDGDDGHAGGHARAGHVDGQTIGRMRGHDELASEPQRSGPRWSAASRRSASRSKDSFYSIGRVFGPAGIGRVGTPAVHRRAARARWTRSALSGSGSRWGRRPSRRLGRRPLPVRVRHGVHRARQPAPAPAVRRRPPRGAADREAPWSGPSTCGKLIPVSAVVMAFFVLFILATSSLDITKPIDPVAELRTRRVRRHDFSTRPPAAATRAGYDEPHERTDRPRRRRRGGHRRSGTGAAGERGVPRPRRVRRPRGHRSMHASTTPTWSSST